MEREAMPFDGYELPDELRMLRDVVADFVANEIRPVEAGVPPDARELPAEERVTLQKKARDAGFWCFEAPAQFGGAGLSTFEMCVVLEAASKHRYAFPRAGDGVFGRTPPVVLYNAGQEKIDRFVRPAIDEAWETYTAISEPSGGSDPARAIRTSAVRSGDSYVLNGRKMWATNADRSEYGIVYARTDREGGRSGISAFIVERGTPGVTVTEVPVLRDHWTTEVALDDCTVPAENLVGEEGQGFQLAQDFLFRGRLYYAAQSCGVADEAVRMAIEWARQRETFGALLATRQAVQFAIADSLVEIRAGRYLTWEAAWKDDRGENAQVEASIAKLYCTEMGFRVVDRMMQVLGGLGVSMELPLEHWFRALRVARIVEGPSEVHRYLIARDALGAAATGRSA
jgi:acyl-CoA dehydrogenase